MQITFRVVISMLMEAVAIVVRCSVWLWKSAYHSLAGEYLGKSIGLALLLGGSL